MTLLSDAWLVLRGDAISVLVFSACVLWGSIIILWGIRAVKGGEHDAADLFSLALGGWILPAFLLSVPILTLAVFLKVLVNLPIAAAFLTVSAGASIWSNCRRHLRISLGFNVSVFVLAALFFGSLLLRLAFIAKIPLPLYFDSPVHYRIIQSLMGDITAANRSHPLTWPALNYYHLGYHIMLAVAASISHVNLGRLMLVSGQVVLAAVPFPLFLIAHRETGSSIAGVVAVILGALGWYMPAHALNWGKYPALFSLPGILFTLNAAYLASKSGPSRAGARSLGFLAVLGACVSFFIHTRSIIVLGLMVSAWLAAKWWQDRSRLTRLLLLGLTIFTLISLSLLLDRNSVLNSTVDPYLGAGFWITALVGLLSVPALLSHPRLAFSALLAAVLLLAGLFVPAPNLVSSTLLDRPLVEMIFFIPLCLLGAAGLAGMLGYFASRRALAQVSAALISLFIAFHAFSHYGFYPAACCSLVEQSDLGPLDWLGRNLPSDARILISSGQMRFLPAPYPPEIVATDAGAWILPLADRQTPSMPYWTDFRAAGTLQWICKNGVSEIFVGGLPQSFNAASLEARPDWYELILFFPRARVYRTLGCLR